MTSHNTSNTLLRNMSPRHRLVLFFPPIPALAKCAALTFSKTSFLIFAVMPDEKKGLSSSFLPSTPLRNRSPPLPPSRERKEGGALPPYFPIASPPPFPPLLSALCHDTDPFLAFSLSLSGAFSRPPPGRPSIKAWLLPSGRRQSRGEWPRASNTPGRHGKRAINRRRRRSRSPSSYSDSHSLAEVRKHTTPCCYVRVYAKSSAVGICQ